MATAILTTGGFCLLIVIGGFYLAHVSAKWKFRFRYRGMEIKASAKLRTR